MISIINLLSTVQGVGHEFEPRDLHVKMKVGHAVHHFKEGDDLYI